jgi:hypothetical protein
VRKKVHAFDDDLISLLPEYHSLIYRYFNFGKYEPQIKFESVTKRFLDDLNSKSFSQRPDYRRLKAEIDTSLNEVLILPDLLSESFSCEIKVNYLNVIIILNYSFSSQNGLDQSILIAQVKFVAADTVYLRF